MRKEATIQENNLKILYFMNSNPVKSIGFVPTELHYHDNNDCIQQVINKIRSTYHPFHGQTTFMFDIDSNRVSIKINVIAHQELICFSRIKDDNLLKAEYECVIKFIDWYKSNKKLTQFIEPFKF